MFSVDTARGFYSFGGGGGVVGGVVVQAVVQVVDGS